MPVYCAKCRKPMPDAVAFCPNCGASKPANPVPVPQTKSQSGRAEACFWFGLLGWFPIAVPLGIAALRDLRRHPGKSGRALAISGLALSAAYIAFWVWILCNNRWS